jgi:hypothetical protein
MFDSPFDFCPVCKEYVLLDQAQRQCALEHHCADASRCPLRRYFTGIEFGGAVDATSDARAAARKAVSIPISRRSRRSQR